MIFSKFFNKTIHKEIDKIKKEINNLSEELERGLENIKLHIRCKLQREVPELVREISFDKDEVRNIEKELNNKISNLQIKPNKISKKSNHLDDVVRLKRLGNTQFQIADLLGLSQGSVSKYIRKAKDLGMLEDKRLHGRTNLIHLEINKEDKEGKEEIKLQ